jgi:signal peptidase II
LTQTSIKKWLLLILTSSLVIVIDQISKAWIVANFEVGSGFAILEPFLYITRSTNTGVAFGLGEGGNQFFLVLVLLLVAGLFWMYQQSKANAILQHIALALIIGGALGNLIDRIQHGYVVDFVHIVLPGIVSNVSNFADHAIVIGVPLMLLDGILQERKESAEKPKIEELEEVSENPISEISENLN